MRTLLSLLFLLGAVSGVQAADIAAGKETAEACAACHGANGISVNDDIPNLAGQKVAYIVAQLKAFKAGTRKNPFMNAIAPQLEESEIENLAAFFNSLPGAAGTAKSEPPAAVAETRVTFPEDYEESFTAYTRINFPDRKQVRTYYANDVALAAAKAGEPLPDGAFLFVEVFKAKLDAEQEPIMGDDGFYQAESLAAFTAMQKQSGWGDAIPEILRNGDWNYAVFDSDGSLNTGVNQATCLACHKPLDADSYVFSMAQLREKARAD